MKRLWLVFIASIVLTELPSIAAGDHPVFDLVANRTLAHTTFAHGLYIAAGAPSFARYVHFSRPLSTWRMNATEDGKRVALATAQAQLEFPVEEAVPAGAALTLRVKSTVRQTVRATIGKSSTTPVTLQPGWQTVSISLPALAAGELRLTLNFTEAGMFGAQHAAAAVEWLSIGARSAVPEAGLPRADKSGLPIGAGQGVAFYVQIPANKGALVAQVTPPTCALTVHVTAHGQPTLDGTANNGSFDLAALAHRVARIELGTSCPAARVSGALTMAGDEPVLAIADPAVKRPRNIVFWMTDDTRSDKYKQYNPKTRVETPVFDALSKTSTLFEVGYVQGNESRVSHASLWTAMYPAQHHFISEKAKLDAKFVTLAEVIKSAGLYTAGLMANGFIDAFWGFGDGWDLLKNNIHDGGGLKAEDLVKEATDLLAKRAAHAFFIYLGTIDVHVSWRAHMPWIAKYDPEPYAGPFVKACLDPQLDQIVAGKLKVTERDKTRIIALYDSDVSYNDQQLGVLVDALAKSGHADDTMIVVTADHGEELWDHGRIGHGQSIREELVHVPMLIHYPPLFPAQRVTEGVELIDLLPTMAEAVGAKMPPDAQGESLIALSEGRGRGYPRPAIASQYELAHSMRLSRWKLWVGGSGDTRLFDAVTDAAEAKELTASHPYERRFVEDALGLWMAYQGRWKKTRWGVASNHLPALADDLEK